MDLMLLFEAAMVLTFGALGVLAIRETKALRRWDPAFFRRGWVIFREETPLSHRPTSLPAPTGSGTGFFSWAVEWQQVSPFEFIFTAQTTNSPFLKGLLFFDESTNSLVVTGRVVWGTLPLFVLGFSVMSATAAVPPYVVVPFLLFIMASYLWERRRFRQIFHRAAAVLASEVQPRG